MYSMWARRPASIAAASARLMAAPVRRLDRSLVDSDMNRTPDRTSGNERYAQPDAQAPPEYPSRVDIGEPVEHRKGSESRHVTALRRMTRDRSSLNLFTLTLPLASSRKADQRSCNPPRHRARSRQSHPRRRPQGRLRSISNGNKIHVTGTITV